MTRALFQEVDSIQGLDLRPPGCIEACFFLNFFLGCFFLLALFSLCSSSLKKLIVIFIKLHIKTTDLITRYFEGTKNDSTM
jgi:hypothetical protein